MFVNIECRMRISFEDRYQKIVNSFFHDFFMGKNIPEGKDDILFVVDSSIDDIERIVNLAHAGSWPSFKRSLPTPFMYMRGPHNVPQMCCHSGNISLNKEFEIFASARDPGTNHRHFVKSACSLSHLFQAVILFRGWSIEDAKAVLKEADKKIFGYFGRNGVKAKKCIYIHECLQIDCGTVEKFAEEMDRIYLQTLQIPDAQAIEKAEAIRMQER